MRIGILTFHKAINYGAYLQAFSLSKKLQEQFPEDEVEIVDYIAPKEKKRKLYVFLWNIKHHGIGGGFSEWKRIHIFRSLQKYLPCSPKSFCTSRLHKLYAYIDQRYDMLIIGSDAVFNWNQTKFPTAYIPDYPFHIPVYTYAASVHGLRYHEEPVERLEKCGRIFDTMKYIGVRDACSEQFVKDCSQSAYPLHCCDPTLFIDTEELKNRGDSVIDKIKNRYDFSLDSKYIVIMAPDSAMTKAIAKTYGGEYTLISVFVRSADSELYLSDLNPFEWAVVLKKAALVVTSYFHGTLLSLVQGTPAVVLDYSGYCDTCYESKLKDLMITRLSLPELYYDQKDAVSFNESSDFLKKTEELLAGKYDEKIRNEITKEQQGLHKFLKVLEDDMHRQKSTC